MKKVMLVLGVILVLVSGLVVAGCGEAEEEIPAEEELLPEKETPETGGMSPAEVVRAFYRAANAGNYEEAKSHVFSETIEFWENLYGEAALKKVITKEKTQNGTIERIEIVDQETQGEFVIVHFIIYFEDGLEARTSRGLRIENGVWKLTDI